MSIPDGRPIKVGEVLLDLKTERRFTVLCNCARSHPRNHTQRYITQNRGEFALHTPTTPTPTPTPSPGA